MGALTEYARHAILNHDLRNTAYTPVATVYFVLFTSAPSADGTGGTEASNYTRPAAAFDAASGDDIVMSAFTAIEASGGDIGTVVAVGIADASTGGNRLAVDADVADHLVEEGEFYRGKITVSLTGNMVQARRTAWLDAMFRNQTVPTSPTTVYSGLDTTTGTTEVTGGGYGREATAFDAPSSGTCANSDDESWTATGGDYSGSVAGWSVWDASSSGNRMWADDLDDPPGAATMTEDNTLDLDAGTIQLSLT